LKVLLVNLLAALNFAGVFKDKKGKKTFFTSMGNAANGGGTMLLYVASSWVNDWIQTRQNASRLSAAYSQ